MSSETTETFEDITAFLLGEGTLGGHSFDELAPATGRPAFWWRKYLRAALAAHTTALEAAKREARLIELDLLEQAINAGRDMNQFKLQRLAALTKPKEKQ